MAQATIFVELDTSSVTQGSKVLTNDFGNALRQVQSQANSSLPVVMGHAGNLDKTLNRLSSSRAPQFMGALTSAVTSSIPAFQGSSAAMGLMSTGAFALQRSLVSLIGPAGFILLAVSALVALTASQISSKKSMEELGNEAGTLGGRLIELKKAGIDATFTQGEFTKKVNELKKAINETSVTLTFWQKVFVVASDQFGSGGIKIKFWADAIEKSGRLTAKAKEELGLLLQNQKEFAKEEALKRLEKWNKGLEVSAEWLAKITNRTLPSPVLPSLKDSPVLEWGTKQLTSDLEELIQKEVAARKEGEREWEKINQKRLQAEAEIHNAQAQTIQSISSSFAETFADMLLSGKAAWDDLLKYWLKKLLESAILDILSSIFSFGSGGGIFKGIESFFGFQSGTNFVPSTGFYRLHRGEAVIPAAQNPFSNQINNHWGQNTFIININNTMDENTITKELLPKLRRMSQERRLGF